MPSSPAITRNTGLHVASAGQIRRHLAVVLESFDGRSRRVRVRAEPPKDETVKRLRRTGFAAGGVKRVMTSAKAAIMWAFKHEIITTPRPFLPLPEGEAPERVVSIEELARFWDAAEQYHLQAFVMGMLCTLAP